MTTSEAKACFSRTYLYTPHQKTGPSFQIWLPLMKDYYRELETPENPLSHMIFPNAILCM